MAEDLHVPINQLHIGQRRNHRNNMNLVDNDDEDVLIDEVHIQDDGEDNVSNNVHDINQIINDNNTSNNDDNQPGLDENQHLYLTNCKSFYACIHCRSHLADHDNLVSRAFTGSRGRAQLFDKVVNIRQDEPVLRSLITGQHLVADIYCSRCETRIGWRYEKAYDESQKYKEGKFVIELYHVVRENRHLELDESDKFFGQRLNDNDMSHDESNNLGSQTNDSDIIIYNNYPKLLTATANSNTLAIEDKCSSNTTMTPGPSSETTASDKDDKIDSLQISHGQINDPRKLNLTFGEDLLYTFYDDWCANRANHPRNLSMNHYCRLRRSLYSESKPYDWKQVPQNSGMMCGGQVYNPINREGTININSFESRIMPSTSTTSSSGVSSGISINSPSSSCCGTSANLQQRLNDRAEPSSRRHKPRTESFCQDMGSHHDDYSNEEDEIQFELEADRATWDEDLRKCRDQMHKLNSGLITVDDDEYFDCYDP